MFAVGLKSLPFFALATATLAQDLSTNAPGLPGSELRQFNIPRKNLTRRFQVGTNTWVFVPTNRFPTFTREMPSQLPKPGVYETAPYTCIVVVPSGQIDERSLVVPASPGPKMPIIKPDLQLIPRDTARK